MKEEATLINRDIWGGVRSHAGHFFLLVFLLIIWWFFFFNCFLRRSYTNSGIYIYSSGTNHDLRKTPYLPNPICYASAIYLGRNLTFTAIFWVLLTDQFDAFNPKNASETNATKNTPPTSKPYEFTRHRCCLPLNFGDNANHSHFDRCQPLTDRSARATQRSFTG